MQQVETSYNSFLFVYVFYALEFPLFYNHHNHESHVTMIPSVMGTYQGDLLGGAPFVLAHLRALCSIINSLSFCLFPSIAHDMHIIGPLSIVSSTYEHF